MNGPASREALASSLFREGGTIAALAGPALVLVFGVLGPLGLLPAGVITYEHLKALLGWPARLVLLPVFALVFFHAAHRARFLLRDLGLTGVRRLVAWGCYAAAAGLTLWAGWVFVAL
jgi:fumarate reductase subunit D